MFKTLRNKRGQNTLEYVLMMAMVAGLVLAVFGMFQTQIKNAVTNVGNRITAAINQVGSGAGGQ